MHEENELNPIIRLYYKIFTFGIFNHKFLEYIKLVEIVIIQMLTSIEYEQTFNTINLMKKKSWNHLNTHLDFYTRFYIQHFFILQNFPYDQAIAKWQSKLQHFANA